MSQLKYAVVVIFTLLGLVFQTIPTMALVPAQEAVNAHQKEVFKPSAAEPPIVVNASGEQENDLSCYWRVVIDELIPWGATTTNLKYETSADAYSGASVFKQAQSGDVYITLKASFETGDADLIFVRGWTRGQLNGAIGAIYVNGPLFEQMNSTGDWTRHEKVLDVTTGDVSFAWSVFSVGSTSLQFDQIGIGYCHRLPDPSDDNIQIEEPSAIDQSIAPLMLFGGVLYNHGTSALAALSKEGGVLSYEELWNRGLAQTVLNRKWLLGQNPMGFTQGMYLGDKLWMSRDFGESFYHAIRVGGTRCFDEGICLKKIDEALLKLQNQIRSKAPQDAIDATKLWLTHMEGQLKFFKDVSAQGYAWMVKTPMVITFEMKESEMSVAFDAGRYQYVKGGFAPGTRIRSIWFPEGTPVEYAKTVYRILVGSPFWKAPRTMKVLVGDSEVTISLWQRYAGYLVNTALPQLVAWGGTAYTLLIETTRNIAMIAVEYAPYAAVGAVGGDLTGTMVNYMQYGDTSQYSWEEFLVSENLLARTLFGLGVIQMPTTSDVGISSSYSSVKFCIPNAKDAYTGFDLQSHILVHPEVCSYQLWRAEVTDDIVTLTKENGVKLVLEPKKFGGTYTMVSYDANMGMVLIDFWVRTKFSNTQAVEVTVEWTGFSTPEERGQCPGWLPAEKAAEFGRAQCPYVAYMPAVQR